MNFKPLASFLWLLILDILAVLAVFWAVSPFAQWYLSRSPAIGVDLYNSISYVSYQLRHFSLPFDSFRDLNFGGFPLILDTPQLAFYLMMPFAAFYTAGLGVQLFAIFSLFLLIFGCYILFFKLTGNFGIAIFLAILVLLSVNIYGDLTWAGSIPYFLSQAFFPLGLFLGVRYFWEPNLRNLGLLGVISGIGFLIHPLSVIAFLLPSVLLFIIGGGIHAGHSLLRIIKYAVLFGVGFILCSFLVSGRAILDPRLMIDALRVRSIESSATTLEGADLSAVSKYYKDQIPRLWQDTNPLIFQTAGAGIALSFLAFIFGSSKKAILMPLVFGLVAIWSAAHPYLNLSGKLGIFVHDPYRAFWQFPVASAALAASLFGYFLSTFGHKLWSSVYLKAIHISASLLITVLASAATYFIFKTQINEMMVTIESMATQVELSSAYPEALSVNLQDKEGLNRLKGQLLPSFIDPNDKNKRLYEADATVNIWWNSFFDVPLARGYTDPPLTPRERGGLFWLDIAMTGDTIMKVLEIDSQTALSNALFLIDWNGIGYFEGGREGIKGPSLPPSSYLLEKQVFSEQEEVTAYGRVVKYNSPSGKPELNLEVPEKLIFYKVDDKFTSPILTATNAPPILVIGIRAGYEDVLRVLASDNINSRKLIPVWGGEFIDEFNLKELANFDAVVLNQYKYKSKGKVFDMLGKYVRDGGKVFIDSGGEVKDASGADLPELFPFASSERKATGRQWDISAEFDEILKGVDTGNFGPLVFNDDEWKLTTPIGDLRPGSKILLTHKDKPVLVSMDYGRGRVVWSGINLPYHYSQYKKNDEAKIFNNTIAQFTDVSDHSPIDVNPRWIRPEKVSLEVFDKPRGILFKEEGYEGWSARLASGKRRTLPVYLAGPTYPGYMYVPLGDLEGTKPIKMEFSYRGKLIYWIQTFVNLAAVAFIFEFVFFDGRLFGKRLLVVSRKLSGKLFKWWEKEEE